MKLLYGIFNRCYYLLAGCAGPFKPKAKAFYEGRKGLIDKIRKEVTASSPIIWVHCSSVGEFEQARPVMEWYGQNAPQYKILLTFFSPSGYQLRKNYDGAAWVYYLPVDTRSHARAFLDAVSPEKAIFVKYEFWYNYLTELKKRGIETYLISAIFRPSQPFFQFYGGFFRKMLRCFTMLFVQDTPSAELLASIGICKNVKVCGDTRFDRVCQIIGKSKYFPIIEKFTSGNLTLIAGSTWKPDEEIIAKVLKNFKKIKLVIIPHETSGNRIEEIEEEFKDYNTLRFSWFDKKYTSGTEYGSQECSLLEDVQNKIDSCNVLIIDCVGILSAIYRYGDFAYIGGGFGAGIHNILEAAAYSIPVIFGPNHKKFKEARDLLKAGGAQNITDSLSLYSVVNNYVKHPESLKNNGNICGEYVRQNRGATLKIVKETEKEYFTTNNQ